jgi:hypothetical protein
MCRCHAKGRNDGLWMRGAGAVQMQMPHALRKSLARSERARERSPQPASPSEQPRGALQRFGCAAGHSSLARRSVPVLRGPARRNVEARQERAQGGAKNQAAAHDGARTERADSRALRALCDAAVWELRSSIVAFRAMLAPCAAALRRRATAELGGRLQWLHGLALCRAPERDRPCHIVAPSRLALCAYVQCCCTAVTGSREAQRLFCGFCCPCCEVELRAATATDLIPCVQDP